MIKQRDRKNCIGLTEFNMSRVTAARGGEHAYFWYYEGNYDPYFQALDKIDLRCMVLFCDRLLYCLCPLFDFTIFFLHGLLRHKGTSDAITNFIFPHFHNTKKENVIDRLTENIRANIKGD